MELPHDIEERIERRWFARRIQEMEIRQQKKVLNETEVTDKKFEDQPSGKHTFFFSPRDSLGHAVNDKDVAAELLNWLRNMTPRQGRKLRATTRNRCCSQ